MDTKELKKIVFWHALAQMTACTGICKCGQEAEHSLTAKFAQLDDLSVFKQTVKATAHGCHRSKQQLLYNKFETASLMVGTNALAVPDSGRT